MRTRSFACSASRASTSSPVLPLELLEFYFVLALQIDEFAFECVDVVVRFPKLDISLRSFGDSASNATYELVGRCVGVTVIRYSNTRCGYSCANVVDSQGRLTVTVVLGRLVLLLTTTDIRRHRAPSLRRKTNK